MDDDAKFLTDRRLGSRVVRHSSCFARFDLATIRYVAEFLGNEHQPGYVNASSSFGDIARNERDSATGVPLVPGNVLRELGDDDRLVTTGNLPPLHAAALTQVPRRWQHHTRPVES